MPATHKDHRAHIRSHTASIELTATNRALLAAESRLDFRVVWLLLRCWFRYCWCRLPFARRIPSHVVLARVGPRFIRCTRARLRSYRPASVCMRALDVYCAARVLHLLNLQQQQQLEAYFFGFYEFLRGVLNTQHIQPPHIK